MNRLCTAIAAASLTGGLLGLAPQASAEPGCPDPTKPIDGFTSVDVAVGTTKVKTVELGVDTLRACGIDDAVAVLAGPRTSYRIDLQAGSDTTGADVRWTGKVKLDPRHLRNSEAGTWKLTYEVSGDQGTSKVTGDARVRRATRASFNAGPEPVKHDRLTFTGKLERASWDSRRYTPVSKPVVVQTLDRHDDELTVDVAELTTKKNGTFRKTVTFPGAGPYWVAFAGGEVSAPVESKADRVSAP
jgi:hypothetical protein